VADDPLLDGLDAEQRDAVTTRAAPLVILAGAGSGKTRVLTRRIAWQARHAHLQPEHVLAVTFTRKAAGELSSRLVQLGVRRQVAAGTFHSIALAQLRQRCADRDQAMPELIDRKVRLLIPILPGKGRERGLLASEIASEIEWAKARLIRPEGYAAAAAAARREPPKPPSAVANWYERYELEKRRRRLIDFDDLLWWCADALENDPKFQETQRWRFRHLFVDEFQDANEAQFRLVRAWLGDRTDLCVVGDGNQAIYGFAGADPTFLTAFERHFPGATVVQLRTNYRSTPSIVRTAGAVLPADDATPVHAVRGDGSTPTITMYDTDAAEARGVAHAVRAARGGGRQWSSIGVLYRTNAQSAAFEEAFAADSIPFTVRGSARFLDRPEVKVALEDLQARSRDHRGRPFETDLAELSDRAAEGSEERREHVAALVRLGREYLHVDGGPGSYDGFLAFLEAALRGGDDGSVGSGDAVELLSFHRAKGLEFPTVFVCGLERGLVPIVHAETPAELDEERRLLHVALSRAEDTLHLSWARKRAIGMRTYTRDPSPWLAEVERALGGRTGAEPAADGVRRAALANARDTVTKARRGRPAAGGLHPAPDPDLFAALVQWRRNLARASGVPAYVIFHDTTLEAVASRRPRSPADLQTIPGIGPVKAARHGEAVLELVRDHDG
jgi:DNA helicase II / ATP-dependent DNA helicase PcrA